MPFLKLLSAALLFLITATMGQAASLTIVGGQVVGATGLNVNGTFYDADFVNLSCVDAFSGCDSVSDFQFGQSDAFAAANAINDLIDGTTFDDNPSLMSATDTDGCTAPSICTVFIPFELITISSNTFVRGALYRNFSAADGTADDVQLAATDPGNNIANGVLALFTRSDITPVPLPAGLPLVLTGLAGFGCLRLRKKRATSV